MADNELLFIWGETEPWVYHGDYQGPAREYAKRKNMCRPRQVRLALHPRAMQLAYVDAAPSLTPREWRRHRQQQLALGVGSLQPGQYCFSLSTVQLPSGLQRHWLLACDACQLQKTWAWWYRRWCVQPSVVIPAWQLLSVLRESDSAQPFDGCVLWCEGDVWIWLVYLADQLVMYESANQAQSLLKVIQAESRHEWPDTLWVVGHKSAALTDLLAQLAWSGERVDTCQEPTGPHSQHLLAAARGG